MVADEQTHGKVLGLREREREREKQRERESLSRVAIRWNNGEKPHADRARSFQAIVSPTPQGSSGRNFRLGSVRFRRRAVVASGPAPGRVCGNMSNFKCKSHTLRASAETRVVSPTTRRDFYQLGGGARAERGETRAGDGHVSWSISISASVGTTTWTEGILLRVPLPALRD